MLYTYVSISIQNFPPISHLIVTVNNYCYLYNFFFQDLASSVLVSYKGSVFQLLCVCPALPTWPFLSLIQHHADPVVCHASILVLLYR